MKCKVSPFKNNARHNPKTPSSYYLLINYNSSISNHKNLMHLTHFQVTKNMFSTGYKL